MNRPCTKFAEPTAARALYKTYLSEYSQNEQVGL